MSRASKRVGSENTCLPATLPPPCDMRKRYLRHTHPPGEHFNPWGRNRSLFAGLVALDSAISRVADPFLLFQPPPVLQSLARYSVSLPCGLAGFITRPPLRRRTDVSKEDIVLNFVIQYWQTRGLRVHALSFTVSPKTDKTHLTSPEKTRVRFFTPAENYDKPVVQHPDRPMATQYFPETGIPHKLR